MGNVLVREESLKDIADAIREKRKSSASFKPSEMAGEIRLIETGGTELPDEGLPVRFFGREGELLYSYSYEEVEQMTELPPFPVCAGLVCQGWNWTLDEIKTAGREVDVGAVFITDDGSTRIYVTLLEMALEPCVGFAQSMAHGILVDWGDGSPLESSELEGEENFVSMSHRYEQAGEYVIRLIPEDGAELYLSGNSSTSKLLHNQPADGKYSPMYAGAIKKVELGKGITSLGTRTFYCQNLEEITIPEGVTVLQDAFYMSRSLKNLTVPSGVTVLSANAFRSCFSLERLILPNGIKTMGSYVFSECQSIRRITLPGKTTVLESNLFRQCQSLKEIVIPYGVTEIGNSAFSVCNCLGRVVIPETVRKISSSAFSNCACLRQVRLPSRLDKIESSLFQNCSGLAQMRIPGKVNYVLSTAFGYCTGIEDYYFYSLVPPSLSSNAFLSINASCRIHVPKGSLEAYQTANLWSELADRMVEMEEGDVY